VGVPPGTIRVVAEPTVSGPDTAVAEAVRILRALGHLGVPVLLHGEEDGAWPVLEYALRLGIDTPDRLRGRAWCARTSGWPPATRIWSRAP